MSNEIMKTASDLITVARDGERSVIERVIALETTYKPVVYDKEHNIDTGIELLGIDRESFAKWQLVEMMERASDGRTVNLDDVSIRAQAIAKELFPDFAKETINHG